MNDANKIREISKKLRKAGDIAESIANNMEDEALTNEEREEKEEQLMGKFLVQMMKIQSIQF